MPKGIKMIRVIALSALFASSLVSAEQWDNAKVDAAGKSGSGHFVILSDVKNAFSGKMFKLGDGTDNTALAIALAAQSNKKQLLFRSNLDEIDNSEIPEISIIYSTDKSIPN